MADAAAIGVDIGSTTWKAVVVDADGNVLASKVEQTDPLIDRQTVRALEELRNEVGAPEDIAVAATGYGRKLVKAKKAITEITCHARGAFALAGKAGILVDMGGQDTKVISVGAGGEVVDFAMNDKCAAGTGRFLEVVLDRLRVPFDDVAAKADAAVTLVEISSTCTVFAESEVISLVAQGEPLEGIIKGLHVSLSKRVSSLASRMMNGGPLYMSGGVAQNRAMVDALSESLGHEVSVLPKPQFVGALGAALAVI